MQDSDILPAGELPQDTVDIRPIDNESILIRWSVAERTMQWIESFYRRKWPTIPVIIRIYWQHTSAHYTWTDVPVGKKTFIKVRHQPTERPLAAELGLFNSREQFVGLFRSDLLALEDGLNDQALPAAFECSSVSNDIGSNSGSAGECNGESVSASYSESDCEDGSSGGHRSHCDSQRSSSNQLAGSSLYWIARFPLVSTYSLYNDGESDEPADLQASYTYLQSSDDILPMLQFGQAGRTRRLNARIPHQPAGASASAQRSLSVLMLAWEYPPLIVGGLARAVHGLSRALARSGLTVHVITRESPGSPASETADGVHVHRVRVLASATPVDFLDWVVQMNLAMLDYSQMLVEQGVDIDLVHAHDWLVLPAAQEWKSRYGKPLAVTFHSTEHGRRLGAALRGFAGQIHEHERRLAESADGLIVCSEAMLAETAVLAGSSPAPVAVIANGVEAAAEPLSRQEAAALLAPHIGELADNDRIILFVGRLVYEKGVQTLIDALPLVQQAVPEARLVIAGAGPYEHFLRNMAARDQQSIRFVGFADEAVRRALLSVSAVCAMPSLYEPFGLAALEAMAFGLPLIAADSGGLTELVEHGVDGYIAAARDAEDWARRLITVLTDREQAATLGAAARRKVRLRYRWEEAASLTNSFYQTILKNI